MDTKMRNDSLDLLKGIACISVVMIHVPFPGKVGEIVTELASFAVPVFYLIAGYYAFDKNEEVIKRRMTKIIKLFICAYFLFGCYYFGMAMVDGEGLQWLVSNFDIKTPIKYIAFCSVRFAIPLWYLIAQIETYIFWLFAVKKKKESGVVKLIPVFFALQIIISFFCEAMGFAKSYQNNFVTRSLVWFALGYYIAFVPDAKIKRLSKKLLVLIASTGAAIECVPIAFDLPFKFTYIGYIPYATSLFLLAISSNTNYRFMSLVNIGKQYSLWIYIFHPIVGDFIGRIVRATSEKIYDSDIYCWGKPIVTIIVTLGVSMFFEHLCKRAISRRRCSKKF